MILTGPSRSMRPLGFGHLESCQLFAWFDLRAHFLRPVAQRPTRFRGISNYEGRGMRRGGRDRCRWYGN